MKLNLNAPFNKSSYGYVSSFLFAELTKLGYDIYLQPISSVDPEQRFAPEILATKGKRFHYDAPTLKIWHQHDLKEFVGRGPKLAFPIFELKQFNDEERHSLEFPDHLIVCSEWARQVILRETSRDSRSVHVVPLGVDPDIFYHKESSTTKTIFLNCGKWEYRKGHDVLSVAFNQAFRPGDNVELWLMPHNVFISPLQAKEWEDAYLRSPMGDHVKILPRLRTQQDVCDVMRQSTCGVFPSRAEGWNLELLEMMALGKEVIATNCTAHTEFCTTENTRLIGMDKTEIAFDGVFFDGRGEWCEFGQNQLSQLISSMLAVSEAGPSLNSAGIDTGKQYTWANAAHKLDKLLCNIMSQ